MENIIEKLSKEQAVILTAFTGITCCNFEDFHGAVEKKLNRPVFTHEFANKELSEEIKGIFKDDFLNILPKGTRTV